MTNLTDEGLMELVASLWDNHGRCHSSPYGEHVNGLGVPVVCEEHWLNEEDVTKAILFALKQIRDAAKKEEREACAKVAEQETRLRRTSLSSILGDDFVGHCHVAEAIRNQGGSAR